MNKNKPIPKAQVRKTSHGWQVYAAGPKGHIAQGQPHKDLGSAKRDAKRFEEIENEDMSLAPKGKGRKAAKALYKEGEWADEKRKEKEDSDRLLKIHIEREKRYQAQQAAKKQPLSITKAGEKALKKGDQKLSITAKGRAAVEEVEIDELSKKTLGSYVKKAVPNLAVNYAAGVTRVSDKRKKGINTAADKLAKEEVEMDEGPPTPKFKPLKHKVWSADASIPAGARPKDPGPIPKYKVSKKTGMGFGAPTNEDKKKTKAEKRKELFKSRKYRFTTPGQDRDFETLDANRMFKSYEEIEMEGTSVKNWTKNLPDKKTGAAKDLMAAPPGNRLPYGAALKRKSNKEEVENEDAPTTSTAGVANWNPVLGGRKRKVGVYFKKRRNVDGRTKDYKETVQRVQARRNAVAARDLEQKLNMFGVQSNPFNKEDKQMENKKYLKTKEGSIEDAVLHSVRTEAPVNPNDARPTLHLPEKKYLTSKDGSLETAVINVITKEDKLSYKERQKLPSGDFALPGKGSGPEGKQGGSYPIPDESHARNALARVSQHGDEGEKLKVRRAVARKFPNIKIGEAKEKMLMITKQRKVR